LLSLARDSSTSSDIFCGLLAKKIGCKLAEEWGMRFGGVVENYLKCVKAVVIDDRCLTSLGRSQNRDDTKNDVHSLFVNGRSVL
jgi:hypothetical protein